MWPSAWPAWRRRPSRRLVAHAQPSGSRAKRMNAAVGPPVLDQVALIVPRHAVLARTRPPSARASAGCPTRARTARSPARPGAPARRSRADRSAAADVVGMEVRHDDRAPIGDAAAPGHAFRRARASASPVSTSVQPSSAGQQVAVDVPGPGRQRERHAPDAVCELHRSNMCSILPEWGSSIAKSPAGARSTASTACPSTGR